MPGFALGVSVGALAQSCVGLGQQIRMALES